MLREKAPGVFVVDGPDHVVTPGDLEDLERALPSAPRGRVRICLHDSDDAPLQAMVILLAADGYVAPHRHHEEAETLTALAGRAGLVLFEDDGGLRGVHDFRPGATSTVLVPPGVFHTLVPLDGNLLVHEARRGPFRPADTERASWAPAEDGDERGAYVSTLVDEVRRRLPTERR